MKIIFVQLTYNDFLNDPDFVKMTLEEKGAYFYLILFLFSKNGPADFENLWRAIGCRDEKHFQEIWDAIGYKFKIKNGKISHKMVASEISRIRKLRQAKRKSGLKGAKKDGTTIILPMA